MTIDKKRRFIIIDDHPLTRYGVINFINAHDCFEFIGEFSDVREVVNSTFTGIPDVIILDLSLPGMDGEKSCSLLKLRFPECKIVAFTNYDREEKELNALGFDGYINKSEKDSLIEAMFSVLEGNKYFRTTDKTSSPSSVEPDRMDIFLKIKQLTPREIEIAKYIIQDFSNKEIGAKIFISEGTVKTHRKHIIEKLRAKNKRELYAMLRTYDI